MASKERFQPPKGMRDFYPADMAVRRYIEGVWREVSINHGFEEVDGPTFEHLDLYTHKSGPGIVSEIFQTFSGKDEEELAKIRAGSDAPFALRPEFTPTLARMVAAKAAELPKPIKWFAIPSHFRAERPQRGRLREFYQWNVDFIGGEVDAAKADAEVIAVAVGALEKLGLPSRDVTVKISHRGLVLSMFAACGLDPTAADRALALLDKRGKIKEGELNAQAEAMGFRMTAFDDLAAESSSVINGFMAAREQGAPPSRTEFSSADIQQLLLLVDALNEGDVLQWCEFDLSIVRGLAYYTGTVFEIIAEGERAVAGGGRYDRLIESFGGPSLPACGFGMGDVVLGILLHEKGLLPDEVVMATQRPHAFVIAANDDAAAQLPVLVSRLRRAGFHVRHSYRATRNVGKLLGEAGKCRARYAVILGDELKENAVAVKNLDGGEQTVVALDSLEDTLRG
ncbi:MAG TPA: histidine--tRNA ligase [Phycisphaerales bacterium]|nr:histidine--tRNA ligase [Phycisphaerales bacterium]HRQ76862.1 histidine--tRNA ligase [Phycisphaerales bacterium]